MTAEQVINGVKSASKRPTRRIPTGFAIIDKMTGGGVGAGEVCLVIGKSGSGKSLVGQNIVEANLDKAGVFFSLEMPGMLCFARSLAQYTGIDYFQVFDTMNQEGELNEKLVEKMGEWQEAHEKMYLVTRSTLTLDEMSSVLAECEEKLGEKPAYCVIDYLELVGVEGGSGEAIENVTNVAQRLKAWAKQHNIAVYVLHQTNKSLRHGDAPDEESARYGGFTEADVVIGVWRPHRWAPHDKKRPPMSELTTEALKNWIAVNVIKNRPRIELDDRGWLFPLHRSGKIVNDRMDPPPCHAGFGPL
jgi:replicative DNA helicase